MLFFSDVSGIRPKARLPNLSFPNGNLCNQKQNPQNFLLELLLSSKEVKTLGGSTITILLAYYILLFVDT